MVKKIIILFTIIGLLLSSVIVDASNITFDGKERIEGVYYVGNFYDLSHHIAYVHCAHSFYLDMHTHPLIQQSRKAMPLKIKILFS